MTIEEALKTVSDSERKLIAVITGSQDLAHKIQSELRNVGVVARTDRLASVGDFEQSLPNNNYDLVLVDEAAAADAPQMAIHCAEDYDPDLPVVVMGKDVSLLKSMGAIDIGGSDFVSYREMRHMCLICQRELDVYDDRRRLQALFKHSQQLEDQAHALLRATGEPFAYVQEGIVTELNDAFAEVLGFEDENALVGTPLLDHAVSADQAVLKGLIKKAGKSDNSKVDAEVRFSRADGSQTAPLKLNLSATTHDNEPAIRCSITRTDGSATGGQVGSRAALFEALGRLDGGDDDFASGVVFVTLDEFDSLEERLGLLDSEEVVDGVLSIIGPAQAPGDRVFRFSSSELALVVRRSSADALRGFAEQLQQAVAEATITTSNHETGVTVTAVAYPMGAQENLDATLRNIRGEARKASSGGGNKALFIGPTAEASERKHAAERQANKIKDALKDDMLRLVYQPIASFEGVPGQVYDTHVRMFDANGNEYAATEFLPVAVQFDLMTAIDCWVVRAAVKNLADNAGSDAKTTIFVRMSNDTLAQPSAFITAMNKAREEFDVGNGEIIFEISEFLLRDNRKKADALAKAMKDAGIGLAIDRFGTNSNSLQMLDFYQPRFVKLDRSFTAALTASSQGNNQARFNEIIEVAHERGVKTVAEHVEDAVAMAKLWQLGINYVQGNHVQEPEVILAEAVA